MESRAVGVKVSIKRLYNRRKNVFTCQKTAVNTDISTFMTFFKENIG